MTLLIIAFLSGVLTVLAPCVLPLLPIVLGASAEDGNNKKIPFVIIGSLSISIILFSLILKASTVLIGVPPSFWKAFSGGMIIVLGIITIFPNLWKTITSKFKLSDNSNKLLHKSSEKKGTMKYVFMGFALGPVFSSCSPTYALILAIVLPAGFLFGFIALISYTLGLAVILFAIAIFGQKLVKKLKGVSDPNSRFKKVLGVIFVLVGVAIITGYDKKIEAKVLEVGFLNTTNFEQKIIKEFELDEIQNASSAQIQENSTSLSCSGNSCMREIEGSLDFLKPQNLLSRGIIYPAPDISGLSAWVNTQGYQNLSQLRGKVVMIKFWNIGCPSCIAVQDETNSLYDEFSSQGFEILGIHVPEFATQRNVKNIESVVQDLDIGYPVALDNDYNIWKRYNNVGYPAFYIIDPQGNLRYTHLGEGGFEEKRRVIQELISEL